MLSFLPNRPVYVYLLKLDYLFLPGLAKCLHLQKTYTDITSWSCVFYKSFWTFLNYISFIPIQLTVHSITICNTTEEIKENIHGLQKQRIHLITSLFLSLKIFIACYPGKYQQEEEWKAGIIVTVQTLECLKLSETIYEKDPFLVSTIWFTSFFSLFERH